MFSVLQTAHIFLPDSSHIAIPSLVSTMCAIYTHAERIVNKVVEERIDGMQSLLGLLYVALILSVFILTIIAVGQMIGLWQ